MSLEPIAPDHALELYLTDRETGVTQATLYSHRSRLGHFIRWYEDQDISNLNELSDHGLVEKFERNDSYYLLTELGRRYLEGGKLIAQMWSFKSLLESSLPLRRAR